MTTNQVSSSTSIPTEILGQHSAPGSFIMTSPTNRVPPDQLNAALHALQKENEGYKKQIQILYRRVNDLLEQISQMQGMPSQPSAAFAFSVSPDTRLLNPDSVAVIKNLEKQIETHKAHIKALNNDVIELQKQIKIQDMPPSHRQFIQQDDTIRELKERNRLQAIRIKELEMQRLPLGFPAVPTQTSNSELEKRIRFLEEQVEHATVQAEQATEERDRVKTEVHNHKRARIETLSQRDQEKEDLRSKIRALKAQNKELANKINEYARKESLPLPTQNPPFSAYGSVNFSSNGSLPLPSPAGFSNQLSSASLLDSPNRTHMATSLSGYHSPLSNSLLTSPETRMRALLSNSSPSGSNGHPRAWSSSTALSAAAPTEGQPSSVGPHSFLNDYPGLFSQ